MGCDQSKPIPLVDDGPPSTYQMNRSAPSHRAGSMAHIQQDNEQPRPNGTSTLANHMKMDMNGATTTTTNNSTSTATPYNRAKDRVDAIAETKTIICNGVKMQYAYVSQRGFYPEEPFKANQDAYCIHTNLIPGKDDSFFAVFDGHGKDGDGCAIFAKNHLPKHIVQRINGVTQLNQQNGIIDLSKDQVQQCLKLAHVDTNKQLRKDPNVDDSLSGTTAISIYFHGRRNRITVSNVGDSRVVIGQVDVQDMSVRNPTIKAFPLSRDQTPYRKDERIRIRATGARVLSLDQLEGLEPILPSDHDATDQSGTQNDTEFVLGDQIDEGGDPPRVWHPTEDYPGTAFTRSIGDALAEDLGVYSEPEMLTREIQPQDRILVIASDGVYEFLTNQSVIDICAKFSDPLEACRAVVAESYELWLQYELRTDDITIICIFIEGLKVDDRRPSIGDAVDDATKSTGPSNVPDTIDSSELLSVEGLRPVRKNVSKEKSKAIEKLKQQGKYVDTTEDETVDLQQLATYKTAEEKGAIADAIKVSIMFRNITEEQRELIYSCMESIKVKAGTWVIRQGTVGDRFYIVDDGLFEVRIVPDGEEDVTGQGGHIVHQYEGSRKNHAHPSFGELALMHSAPRSASIVAKTDGHLWALHRAAFRQILVQSQDHRKELKNILREIPYFNNLDNDGINKLSAIMEDITFGRGDTIIEQGNSGTKLFVVDSGSAYSTEILGNETRRSNLKAGMYFGDELLSNTTMKYNKTVMAMQTTTCWQLDIPLLQQTMGPLLRK
jgi:serine/threonine protein phosphatase PrpC/CRP-like cAMP-binding protein